MRKVWKYPIEDGGHFTLQMPRGAKVLYVDAQNGRACMWALVDPEAPTEDAYFRLVGTGFALTGEEIYLGSCQLGPFVWHLFRLNEATP